MSEGTSAPAGRRPGAGVGAVREHSDYVRIMDSMTCGVMLIDGGGVVKTLNQTAADLLGLERSAVLRRPFAETFLGTEAFDDFSEAVLSAVYDGSVGHQRVVRVEVGGRSVPLSIATSYLRGDAPSDASGRLGVVAVITDITELEALREREVTLAVDLRSKHEELRTAYLDLEDRNRTLGALLRKVQMARVVASAFVIALMVGLGAYLWHDFGAVTFASSAPVGAGDPGAAQWSFVELAPSPISSSISVPTELRPREEVVVTSPIKGVVVRTHFEPGQAVAEGAALLELDVSELRIKRREAEVALLRAQAEMRTLRQWENGVEVSRSRRALSKVRIAFEAGKDGLARDRFLLEEGLVPSEKVASGEREQRTRELDYESAKQDLVSILSLGEENLKVAEIGLANARAALANIDRVLEEASVRAPVAGVVLGDGARSAHRVKVGSSVEAGASLLTIGDVSGFTARGRVNEVDVRRIRTGQAVRVSGPAFPGVVLEGMVSHVSSEASRSGGRALPSFAIAADLALPEEGSREAVRLGMSAHMRIVVYHKTDALLVPAEAVDVATDPPTVRVDDGQGGVRSAPIRVGMTTAAAVEVLEGLAAGDRVAVP